LIEALRVREECGRQMAPMWSLATKRATIQAPNQLLELEVKILWCSWS